MEGSVGIKRLLVLGVCAAAVLGALLASAPQAKAVSSIPGRIFANFDVGGSYGDLYRSKPDNTWKRLTFGLGSTFGLSADPSGKFVTVTARRGSSGPYRIFRVSANGGPLKNLIGNRSGFDPAVSPDGRKVAYLNTGSSGPTSIKVVSSKGGKPRTIYRFCSGCIYKTIWAGKRIYFNRRISNMPSADFEVYSVRARDGKGLRQHTDDGGGDRDYRLFDVSANGRRLLVVINDSTDPLSPNVGLAVFSDTNIYKRLVAESGTASDIFFGGSFGPAGPSGTVIWIDVGSSPYAMWSSPPGSLWSSAIGPPPSSTLGPLFMDWVRR